jgi:hypothetical protein
MSRLKKPPTTSRTLPDSVDLTPKQAEIIYNSGWYEVERKASSNSDLLRLLDVVGLQSCTNQAIMPDDLYETLYCEMLRFVSTSVQSFKNLSNSANTKHFNLKRTFFKSYYVITGGKKFDILRSWKNVLLRNPELADVVLDSQNFTRGYGYAEMSVLFENFSGTLYTEDDYKYAMERNQEVSLLTPKTSSKFSSTKPAVNSNDSKKARKRAQQEASSVASIFLKHTHVDEPVKEEPKAGGRVVVEEVVEESSKDEVFVHSVKSHTRSININSKNRRDILKRLAKVNEILEEVHKIQMSIRDYCEDSINAQNSIKKCLIIYSGKAAANKGINVLKLDDNES